MSGEVKLLKGHATKFSLSADVKLQNIQYLHKTQYKHYYYYGDFYYYYNYYRYN